MTTRIYGTKNQYGDTPRTYHGVNPITLENYPTPGEEVNIHFGGIPGHILYAHRRGNATGSVILRAMFGGETFADIQDAVTQESSRPEYQLDTEKFNWYITFVLKRAREITDGAQALGQELDSILNEFKTYSREQFDLITSLLPVVVERDLFTNLLIQDRVFFTLPGREIAYLPESKMSASGMVIRPEDAFDGESVQRFLMMIADHSSGQHQWLRSIKYWYVNAIRETDRWKRFQWSFLALEILTNKITNMYRNEIISSLQLNKRTATDIPIAELVWEKSRQPLLSKFAMIASYLCPDEATQDVNLFVTYKRVRDDISHGEIVSEDDLPRDVDRLVTKYLIAAIHKIYGWTS